MQRVEYSQRLDLDYAKTKEMIEKCGGWLRTGGREGTSIQVRFEGTEYDIRGEALIDFLHIVKDVNQERIYAALDLVEYIEKSALTPPSVFVRDAIVARARALKELIVK